MTGLLLVEGGAFGAMNAVLYGQMGAKGVFASAVLFLLPECIRFVFFVLAARCALQTSTSLFAAQFLAKDICTKTGTRALHAYMAAIIVLEHIHSGRDAARAASAGAGAAAAASANAEQDN